MGCCPDASYLSPKNYATQLGSARIFLERHGLLPAYRGPGPRMAPAAMRVHSTPLIPPLPLSELQGYLEGSPPPDRGRTRDWPHPQFSEEEGS